MYLPGYLWQSSNVQYVPNVQSVYIINNNNNEAEKHSSLAFSYYVVSTAEDWLPTTRNLVIYLKEGKTNGVASHKGVSCV